MRYIPILAGSNTTSSLTAAAATTALTPARFLLSGLTTVLLVLLMLSGLTLIAIYFVPSLAMTPDQLSTQSTSRIIELNQPHSKLMATFIVGLAFSIKLLGALPHYATHPELLGTGVASSLALSGVVLYDVSLFPTIHSLCVCLFILALLLYAHIYGLMLLLPHSPSDARNLLYPCLVALDLTSLLFIALFVANWLILAPGSKGGDLDTYQTTAELMWEMAIVALMAAIVTTLSRWRLYWAAP